MLQGNSNQACNHVAVTAPDLATVYQLSHLQDSDRGSSRQWTFQP